MRPTSPGKSGGESPPNSPPSTDARITHTRTGGGSAPQHRQHHSSGTGVPRWKVGFHGKPETPYEEYDLREATRAHGRSFLGMLRFRLGYLVRTRREEGALYSVFDLMMHTPVALIGTTLFLVIARYLHTLHDGGYAVGALAFAYTLKITTTPVIERYCGLRFLLGGSAILHIPAVLYLMHLSNMLATDAASVTTFEYAMACMLAGYTLPPWPVIVHEARYNPAKTSNPEWLFAMVAWTNIEKLALYPLAACMLIPLNSLMGVNAGFWCAIILAGLLVFVVIFVPNILPQTPKVLISASRVSQGTEESPASAISDSRQVRETPADSLSMMLILGLMVLSGCVGSVGAALLGVAINHNAVSFYPLMITVCLGTASVTMIPVLLGSDKIVPWHGWLVSGVILTFAALLLPTAEGLSVMMSALVVYGVALGIAMGGHKLALAQVLVRTPDTQMSFYISGAMALGLTFGATWGGYLGSGPYYRNAFIVPIVAACLYFCMGHLYGYLWRRRYEEQLESLD